MNGNILVGKSIPDEILQAIFDYIPERDLIRNIPLVCQLWYQLYRTSRVWLLKLKSCGYKISQERCHFIIEKWDTDDEVVKAVQEVCINYDLKGFNHNLIKNPSGKAGYQYWKLKHGGNGIVVECPPIGCDPIPSDASVDGQFCFSTSYSMCSRRQVVKLQEYGITNSILKVFQPSIHISEWVSARFDCGAKSRLEVAISGLREHIVRNINWKDSDYDRVKWHKLQCDLKWGTYPADASKIVFTSYGQDTQFWAGNYGAKSTASTVILRI